MISTKFDISLYMEHAAHPNNLIDAITFDLSKGEKISLKELFKDGINVKNELDPILIKKIEKLDIPLLGEFKGIEDNQGFYLTDKALAIYFQEYEYTPHAYGPLIIEVLFDEIKGIIKLSGV